MARILILPVSLVWLKMSPLQIHIWLIFQIRHIRIHLRIKILLTITEDSSLVGTFSLTVYGVITLHPHNGLK
ncbi:capsid protein 1 [Galliform chaphamaparvovirus 16]|nr:capsid protein 1 [Galliform chaphamaparvovirus 16]